jgi:hypothetical protein
LKVSVIFFFLMKNPVSPHSVQVSPPPPSAQQVELLHKHRVTCSSTSRAVDENKTPVSPYFLNSVASSPAIGDQRGGESQEMCAPP